MPHNLKRILVRCHTVCKVSWFICLLGRYRKRHFSYLPKHVPLQRHPEYQGPIPNKHPSNIILQLESKDCFNFDQFCLDSNFPHFRNLMFFFPRVLKIMFFTMSLIGSTTSMLRPSKGSPVFSSFQRP